MSRGSRATCNLTVDQLMAERPKRASVRGAMHYLATCTPEERVEALARADAAFAEIKAKPAASFGPGVPKGRSEHYMKKRLVAVTFVLLANHSDRGTMRASSDGSMKRAFNFNTKGMIIEPESSDELVLAGMPRRTLSWINQKFPAANFGWHGAWILDGQWTDEQRAKWEMLHRTASATKDIIDRATRPASQRRAYVGINPW